MYHEQDTVYADVHVHAHRVYGCNREVTLVLRRNISSVNL